MKWQCIYCKTTKNVKNGECPKCGPTQTVPKDKGAENEAIGWIAREEKASKEAFKRDQKSKNAEKVLQEKIKKMK